MVLNSLLAEKAAKAAQEAAQRAAVAQRKAGRAQRKAQKAAQPQRPRGRPKGVSKFGPSVEAAISARLAFRASAARDRDRARAVADPAAWRARLDKRAKDFRETREKCAAADPAAWRNKLDEKARKQKLRHHAKNPDARSRPKWTQQEDERLLQLVEQFGPNWTQIAPMLPRCVGRHAVRERYTYINRHSVESGCDAT